MNNALWLVMGSHLFDLHHLQDFSDMRFVMIEDDFLCTRFRYHQHKLILFLSAMRHYQQQLQQQNIALDYYGLPKKPPKNPENDTRFFQCLLNSITQHSVTELHSFEIEDRFFAAALQQFCQQHALTYHPHPSPMFLTTDVQFQRYAKHSKKPFLKTFYEQQRKRLQVLLNQDQSPQGGQWSFDADNRRKLPSNLTVTSPLTMTADAISQQVMTLVSARFADHPGEAKHFWLAVTHQQAAAQLEHFIAHHLAQFGDYQDAIDTRAPFLFHSLISPYLNNGLLTPQQVLTAILDAYEQKQLPLNSIEGFIRQLIGWREFVKGIDQQFGAEQHQQNFWQHQRSLTNAWYDGTTGIPPLDDVIKKVQRYGYAHHIERLMILGNMMLLCEIHPQHAYRWFMEMFIDSADWVMGPNVFGMALFSDGGIFATKPYICSSNYWLKMSHYKKGDWCDAVDGLYWRFIDKHRDFFSGNPRLSMMVKMLDKITPERKTRLAVSAENMLIKLTQRT